MRAFLLKREKGKRRKKESGARVFTRGANRRDTRLPRLKARADDIRLISRFTWLRKNMTRADVRGDRR